MAGNRYFCHGLLSNFKPVWVDRQGDAEPIPAPPNNYAWPHLSPDNQRLATTISDDRGRDIWMLDIGRGTFPRFTFDGDSHLPVWTPDGERLIFTSSRGGPDANLFWKRADGSGDAERLLTSEHHQDAGSFSPDGRVLAFAELDPTTKWDLWLLDLEGERKAQPFLRTEFGERHPMISPDGRWLAYSSDESGRFEVYVQPFPGGGRKSLISTAGGDQPLWAPNGRELYYRAGDKVMVASVQTEPQFVPGKPRVPHSP